MVLMIPQVSDSGSVSEPLSVLTVDQLKQHNATEKNTNFYAV